MKPYDKYEAARRIKKLRDERNWSLEKVGKKLAERIGKGKDEVDIDKPGFLVFDENWRQIVNQLEKSRRGITGNIAFAYADIFNVSVDYIYGRIEHYHPQFENIEKELGLNNDAISALMQGVKVKNDRNKIGFDILNGMPRFNGEYIDEKTEHSNFIDFINIFAAEQFNNNGNKAIMIIDKILKYIQCDVKEKDMYSIMPEEFGTCFDTPDGKQYMDGSQWLAAQVLAIQKRLDSFREVYQEVKR